MSINIILNSAMDLFKVATKEEAEKAIFSWQDESTKTIYMLNDFDSFNDCMESLIRLDKNISNRFSRETINEFIINKIKSMKIKNNKFDTNLKTFFAELNDIEPKTLYVTAPISGIRLDYGCREFQLSVFNFGYLDDLKMPLSIEDGMYIQVEIRNICDNKLAIQKAEDAFLDFAKLIVFLSGKVDRSIFINTGLPLRPSVSHEQMYVNSSSFQVTSNKRGFEFENISNVIREKIPVNNDLLIKNKYFSLLWDLYKKNLYGDKLTDIESRVLNSALAVGESSMTPDLKNSVIYTCIALEILFSFDEGSIFQKSIGEKLADMLSFVVAKDKESRLSTGKLTKKVYGMRSAIVHGGNKNLTNKNLDVNVLLRSAINQILNSERFKGVNSISDMNSMLKEAQNSY